MKKNIYLIGFMGTGKTSVGRYLSKLLDREFVEMDEEIEKRENTKIVDIFRVKGEKYFREREKALLKELSCKDNLVVSCGGGIVLDKENIDTLKSTGLVFCLHASYQTIYERVKNFSSRPLLNVDNPLEKIKELLEKRKKYYQDAQHYQIDGERSIEEVAKEIYSILKKEGYA